MSRASVQVLLAFLSLSLAIGPLLPGEHLHVDDDHQTLIHRHLEAHPSAAHDSAVYDHREDAPLWLDGVLASPRTAPQVPQEDGILVERVFATSPPPGVAGVSPVSTPPVHGPPLIPVDFRAPPPGLA